MMTFGTVDGRSSVEATRRVLVIVEDEVERLGLSAVLNHRGGTYDVQAWSLTEAIERLCDDPAPQQLEAARVLLGCRGLGTHFDRYPAVGVAHALKAFGPPSMRVVALVAEPLNPLVQFRLVAAGVDDLVVRQRPFDVRGLVEVLDRPSGRFACPDHLALACLGLNTDTDPEGVLRYVSEHELEAAFEPGVGQAESGLSRRRIMRVRAEIGMISGLRSPISVAAYATGRGLGGTAPSWRAVVAYVNLARGIDGSELADDWAAELTALR